MEKTNTNIISGDYNIYIGEKALLDFDELIKSERYYERSLFILVDDHTEQLCLPVLRSFSTNIDNAKIIKIPSGEAHKNIQTTMQIWHDLSSAGADRKSLLINLGGGMITDIGGFAASTYKRGIDFINLPTTLLAQVDASVGGKTGIDFDHIKNQIGLFSNPDAVFVCPSFLKTLDQRQLKSGFAEVIKHGLIADQDYWNTLREKSLQELNYESLEWETIIAQSISIKNDVVTRDPTEKGLRKVLNFGHTIGHALEAFSLENDADPLLHGEAVAIGMICEAYISTKVTDFSPESLDEIAEFVFSIFGPYQFDQSADTKLLELMSYDKKNTSGQKNFTLLKKIGVAVINQQCNDKLILEALNYYRRETT